METASPAAEWTVESTAESVGALECGSGAVPCVGGIPSDLVEVSARRSGTAVTLRDAARVFELQTEAFASQLTWNIARDPTTTDPDAQLVVEVRKVGADGKVPPDSAPATTFARVSLPVAVFPLTAADVTIPLQVAGGTRKLSAAPQKWALVARIEPGASGDAILRLGTVAQPAGTSSGVMDRSYSSGSRVEFAPVTGDVDLVFKVSVDAAATPSCADGLPGAGESDVDCGGLCVTACPERKRCRVNEDCQSGNCNAKGLCGPPPCANRLLDAGEADIDCGGVCSNTRCQRLQKCLSDNDCVNGTVCITAAGESRGRCRPPTCKNGTKDVGEVNADCGGQCGPCADGSSCTVDAHCGSANCVKPTGSKVGTCAAPTCSDITRNGDETDVDCGGSCADNTVGKVCAVGKVCRVPADCASGRCTKGKCDVSACLDKSLSPGETDVDCGGVCARGNSGLVVPRKCGKDDFCAIDDDCVGGFVCYAHNGSLQKRCVPAACGNNARDGAETDVNCGGGTCLACLDGATCTSAADCASRSCIKASRADKTGVCGSSCTDKAVNGGESDTDCGQVCAGTPPQLSSLCAVNKRCRTNLDCVSGACGPTGVCVEACNNGRRDVNEAGADCGGPCTRKCEVGQRCSEAADCASRTCTDGVCAAFGCGDGVRNGDESAVDCGGSCPDRCPLSTGCRTSTDCAPTLACVASRCAPSACADKVRGGDETDVDCGGSCTKRCGANRACAVDGDCVAGYACSGNVCRIASCKNGRLDGSETDVDCGGRSCADCPATKACKVAADCESGACASGRCTAASVTDKVKNGTETDVDCGGSSGVRCASSKLCVRSSDCVSDLCANGRCTKPLCTDGVRNGTETAVDCGGSCALCPAGRACASSLECATGLCASGRCLDATCADGRRNGDETDADCGGTCAALDESSRCGVGRRCGTDRDCGAGSVCRDYVCTCAPGSGCEVDVRRTTTESCDGVVCNAPPNGCYEPLGACSAGTCVYAPRRAWTACSDNKSCTSHDRCDGLGRCVGAPVDGCTEASAACGNRVADAGEDCDDGNQIDTDACTNTCRNARCGDAIVRAGVEQCDDGNSVDTDGCSNACRASRCGDGAVTGGEDCDDGNQIDTDACTNDCRVNAAPTTCVIDGTPVSVGTVDPANPCQICDPLRSIAAWSVAPAGTLCRTSAGDCDLAEVCDGSAGVCPADGKKASTAVCRPAAGSCDLDETCDGVDAACPADVKKPPTATCRVSAGPCDVAEMCDGADAACPDDVLAPVTVTCRGAAGVCDVAEMCSGASAACPSDSKLGSSSVCRPAAGVCDAQEVCDGTGNACPVDAKQASTVVCRAASDACDRAETCTGITDVCPGDALLAANTTCRAAAGVCDAAEACTGNSAACPPDAKFSTTTVCRASTGTCDVAEICDGVSNACASDGYAASGTSCLGGSCDAAGVCVAFGIGTPGGFAETVIAGQSFKFSYIPAGTYTMGAPSNDAEAPSNERPQHQVTISAPFLMLRTEVTQAQWIALMGSNPSGFPGDASRPVEKVSWYAAAEFCNRMSAADGFSPAYTISGTTVTFNTGATGYRLPTEAEWEHAARAGTTTPRYGSVGSDIAWYSPHSAGSTRPVGQKLPNAWVLYDMLGNVYEWVQDWYGAYSSASQTDPQGPATGSTRVARGGGWFFAAAPARATSRSNVTPGYQASDLGFRPVRPLPSDTAPTGVCSGKPAGYECRPSSGACDPAERCDGTTAACPNDQLSPLNTTCRAAAGVCDAVETCSGASAGCPVDVKVSVSTVCRASAGACDAIEFCDGTSSVCSADGFLSSSTVCRAAAGACDVVERCTGADAACPADARAASSIVCREAAGVCDVAEVCDGSSTTCAADAWASSGTACTGGACDAAGQCVASGIGTPGGLIQQVIAGETFRFSYIPAGTFVMGPREGDANIGSFDAPAHTVTLTRPFLMARTEVTRAQWLAVEGTNSSGFTGGPTTPVEEVSWLAAARYCNHLSERDGLTPVYSIVGDTVSWNGAGDGYRLPTEAEWEYASRAGSLSATHAPVDQIGWIGSNSEASTHPVALKTANAWNLSDTIGNVREWTWDWSDSYSSQQQSDPSGPQSGTHRVIRGGAWDDDLTALVWKRESLLPTDHDAKTGLRVVRFAPTSP